MALSVKGLFEEDMPEIVDPFRGRMDIEKRMLNLVSVDAIEEDPLRILRGFRLAATFS